MKDKKVLVFDLDGTLTDSSEGIFRCAEYALEKQGKKIPSREVLKAFIGPPILQCFQEICGLSEEEAKQGVLDYRERYGTVGKFENEVYEGIPALLRDLQAAGKILLIGTSKPEKFAVEILEHFGIAEYFHCIAGATLDHTRDSKELVLRYALEQAGNPDKGEILMIGDRKYDVLGAKAEGLPCIGVLYGYGDREELAEAGAARIVVDVQELRRELLGE